MNITPNKLTIAQLFATPNEQFLVPSYQRRFAWGYNQYAALYDDIDMLKDNDGHLFGMIILHTSTHVGGLNQPELVDGQQRMTTLVIFLKAFETAYRKKGKKEKASEIKKMITCKDLDDIERSKIVLGDLDNDDLVNLVLNNKTSNMTNFNIESAFNDYINWLCELDTKEINKLFSKLTNTAVIIRLDVGMAQDAYKLFETINNRGLRLTPTDVIKNFLLGHAAKINKDAVLERVKKIWSSIIMNLDGIDTDDFLRQYVCSILHRKITKSKLVHEFKEYYLKHIEKAELLGEYEYYQNSEGFEDSDEGELENDETEEKESEENDNEVMEKISIIDFLEKLELLSGIYRKLSLAEHKTAKVNQSIKNLNSILSKPSYIFLMHFLLEKKYKLKEKKSVMKYIETLMLRRHVCERRTNDNDTIFSKLVPFIGEDDIMDKVKEYIDSEEYMPGDNDFEEYLPKHQFKGKLTDRAKYVLEMIEYHKRGNTNELLMSSSDEVHLEHIIPQTITTKKSKKEFGDWVNYLGNKSVIKHKKYVNYIGNMTLLGETLNIKASNNPFVKKKGSYKKSSFLITSDLSKQSHFKFNHVDKRSKEITELALIIWSV